MKLRNKLFYALFITVCTASVATTVFAVFYFSNMIKQEGVQNIRTVLQVAHLVYQDKLQEIEQIGKKAAQDSIMSLIVDLKITPKINEYLVKIVESEQLNHAIIIDEQGRFLGQAWQHENLSEPNSALGISDNTLLKAALNTQMAVHSAELALIAAGQPVLSMSAAAPIFEENELIGAILVREIVNHNAEITNKIKELTNVDVAFFQQQGAINTSNPQFQLDPAVYQQLMQHQTEYEEFDMRENGHLAKYLTLYNFQQQPIAVLGVSMAADKYIANIHKAVFYLLLIMLFCILLALFLGFLLTKHILTPVNKLITGVNSLTSGDLSQSITVNSKDELGTLGQAFNNMAYRLDQTFTELENEKNKAESANRAKTNFLANVSHELRTPLNSVIGYTQLLLQNNELNIKQQDSLKVIERSGKYLLTLINDILDLSKIETHRLELYVSEFQLNKFLESLITPFELQAQERGIAFIYEPLSPLPLAVSGDEKRLRQIFINLLSNAVKFTKHGGIAFKLNYDKTGQLHFEIEDTGVGIAPHCLESIFSPFHQLDDLNNKASGAGLGLSITKKLIEMMDGALYVESELGRGSRFSGHIPLLEIKNLKLSDLQQTATIIGIEGKPRKILVVDDRWENRRIAANMLSGLGFEIIEASDGREALQQVQATVPDLVLTDLVMPVMDGFEFARQVRATTQFHKLPIIAMSASVLEHHHEATLAAGCNALINKPIDPKKLLKLIEIELNISWQYAQQTPTSQPPALPASLAATNSFSELIKNNLQPSEIVTEKADISVPEPEIVEHLLDLAMQGDIATIQIELHELQQEQPELHQFAQKLLKFANNFEEEQICESLQCYLAKAEQQA